jgi:hypothetical protein
VDNLLIHFGISIITTHLTMEMMIRVKVASSYGPPFSPFWMIIDKVGEEIGLKLHGIFLKVLGVEINGEKKS